MRTNNNRGRRPRGRAAGIAAGLGNRRRTGRRMFGVVEPREMESRLVAGTKDPLPTPDRSVFVRSLMGTLGNFGATSVPFNLTMAQVLDYEYTAATGSVQTSARFADGRITRVELWDSAAGSASDAPITIQILPGTSRGDGAIFRDYGTPGEARAHLAVIPNFDFRSEWINNGSTTALISLAANSTSAILRLTLELR